MQLKMPPLELISVLADGKFHSGEALGEVLGVSRAAVWKKLQGLAEHGLQVESVKGRGYRLRESLSLLDDRQLQIFAATAGVTISVMQNIDSTNAELLRRLASGDAAEGSVIVAEQQTLGRGRRGRSWASPYGKNLYFSMAASFDDGAANLDGLSLVVGLSLIQAIEAQGLIGARLKWPNDVLFDAKKLAGILLEITGDPAGLCHVVIGIGVNISMREAAGAIDQPWISLAQALSDEIDKNQLIKDLLLALHSNLKLFKAKGFAAFATIWRQYDAYFGEEVFVTLGDKQIHGIQQGVNAKGELLISVGGELKNFNGGEVSLRKL